MATISELVEKYSKVPGDLRLKQVGLDANHWFAPYYVSDMGTWYGLNERGESHTYRSDTSVWELWQEPAKKKKVAPYLMRQLDGLIYMTTDFYAADAEAAANWGCTSHTIIRRMTELEVEV